jgi:hypothetical protein
VAELEEFALDALLSPAVVFGGEPLDERGEGTWVIILPGRASPVVPARWRSRLLEPDRRIAAAQRIYRLLATRRAAAAQTAAGRSLPS